MSAPTEEEATALVVQGSRLLATMVAGALREGQMPPREIFNWFADFTTQGLIETERRVLEGQVDADIAADLERYVVSLSEVLRICDANSLLVTKDRIMAALKARRLRMPEGFDYTYEGLLRG